MKKFKLRKLLSIAFLIMILPATVLLTSCDQNDSKFLKTCVYEIIDDFTNISLNTDEADVTVLPSDDEKCRVICKEKNNQKHEVTISDKTLSINMINSRKWYNYIFSFGSQKIDIYIPESEYENLSINDNTGDIEIGKDFSFASINIKVNTGDVKNYASVVGKIVIDGGTSDIYVENVSADSLECYNSTGDIHISSVTLKNELKIDGSTTNIFLNDIKCDSLSSNSGTSDITASSLICNQDTNVKIGTGKKKFNDVNCKNFTVDSGTGDIEIIDVITSELLSVTGTTSDINAKSCNAADIYIKTGTGDVEANNVIASNLLSIIGNTCDVNIERCDGTEIYIKTGTGDVMGSILSEKIFITKTNTGKIEAPPCLTGGKCEITVGTGKIIIEIVD